ncbi:hypothetical protein CEV33_0842 [Brucella grignonensis]|uniref:Uncharacterized protein n=1 Tax=Brucella grignonensis TaxID=94627 RepID=A0A256FE30_9HYPH|nr:hypothetical protein CEV33_0842 [Brucella grignonensis]
MDSENAAQTPPVYAAGIPHIQSKAVVVKTITAFLLSHGMD